jgi:hypothetical protein
MTEQQKKEIEKLRTLEELEKYVKDSNITIQDRFYDCELGDVLHRKRFELIFKEIKVRPLSDEDKEKVRNARAEKYDPAKKGFRQLIIESRRNVN